MSATRINNTYKEQKYKIFALYMYLEGVLVDENYYLSWWWWY